MKAILISALFLLMASAAQANSGALLVTGEAGPYQIFKKVKAIRCDSKQRGVCDAAVFFDLNKSQVVPAGTYILGFENSIYPGWVYVEPGQTTSVALEKVAVPNGVRGEKIKVYRDFTTLTEQRKIYFTMFSMNRHFFRLDKNNFGDLYLTGSWERDFVQRFTYETCPRLHLYPEATASATTVCKAWNTAKRMTDLRDLYDFGADATFKEMWVTFPGDVIAVKHPRYLVSTPMTQTDFVSVFPGVYRFLGEGRNAVSVQVRVGGASESYEAGGFSLSDVRSLLGLGESPAEAVEDCTNARTWRTEHRSYCTKDNQEGCARLEAQLCQGM